MNVKYEKFRTLCITECKLTDEEGVMIGSMCCQGCINFLGIDRKNQIVQCSHPDAVEE